MAPELRKGIESSKAYDMSSLLKKYIGWLEKKGHLWFELHQLELKLRMKSHFSETIVFHQPYQKNSPEIVYSSSISVQDVINRSAIQNNTIVNSTSRLPKSTFTRSFCETYVVQNGKVDKRSNKAL